MTPKFLLADSDPDASLPFIVHTQKPQFFALMTPKFKGTAESLLEMGDLRTALRGINLYPGFLTNPVNFNAKQMMNLFHKSAKYLLENVVGRNTQHQVADENISIVWRESGTYAPKHLYAESEQGDFVIRTESPRMIIQLTGSRGEQVIWEEPGTPDAIEKALVEAREFRAEYVKRELAA